MFITKRALSRRTFCAAWARRWRCRSSTRWCRPDGHGADRGAGAAVRRVFVPLGERPGYWTPTTVGANFELQHDPEAARGVPQSHDVVSQLCDPLDGHATTVAAWLSGAIPKRTLAENVHIGVTVDQVIAEQIGRKRRSRRWSWPPRTSRAGSAAATRLQLRLHEHDLVEERDHADADGDQSASRVRAHVRRPRHERPAPRADGDRPQRARFAARRAQGSEQRAGRRDLTRLNDYLENVREIEQRIQKAEKQRDQRRGPRRAGGDPGGVRGPCRADVRPDGARLRGDLTRVVHVHEVT